MTSAALSTPTDPGQANAVAPASPTPAPSTPATPATEQKGEAAQPAPETPKQQTAADKVLDALKPAEEKKKEGEQEQKPAAPEKYEAWKLPDGVKLSEKVDAEFSALARKAGLSQADAQATLEKLVAANEEQVQTGLRSQVEQWGDALNADPELGGANLLTKTMPSVQRALNAFDKTGKVAALLQNGLGVHPDMVRMLSEIGKAVGEHADLVTGQRFAPKAATVDDLYEATKVK